MSPRVRCDVRGFKDSKVSQSISFDLADLRVAFEGGLGPAGLTPGAADLLDFAAAVMQVEHQLAGRQRTNPPVWFRLRMPLRRPQAWTARAKELAAAALQLLGNAEWQLELLLPTEGAAVARANAGAPPGVDQVVLFSGGLDSTCGAATLTAASDRTRLVSFYTRQKALQQQLAEQLGFKPPLCQARIVWQGSSGRGRSFFYRSFFFLALAAAAAQSWGTRRIEQFENGVLATAIPPTPAFMMTKHAHPALHRLMAQLFTELLGGGDWEVVNPFANMTKRECVALARKTAPKAGLAKLLPQTQTCWFYWSNRIRGEKADTRRKRPGEGCGVCIPCLVRRTAAVPHDHFTYDLRLPAVNQHPEMGRAFRSYQVFLDRVLREGKTPGRFYALLPAAGRMLLDPADHAGSLGDLKRLFETFAREFKKTFP